MSDWGKLVDVIAVSRSLPRVMLELHANDGKGQCLTCQSYDAELSDWPCEGRKIAGRALVRQAQMQVELRPYGVIRLEAGRGPERLDRRD